VLLDHPHGVEERGLCVHSSHGPYHTDRQEPPPSTMCKRGRGRNAESQCRYLPGFIPGRRGPWSTEHSTMAPTMHSENKYINEQRTLFITIS
jgi:hypothetical protein